MGQQGVTTLPSDVELLRTFPEFDVVAAMVATSMLISP